MTNKSASRKIDEAFAKFPSEMREIVSTIRAIIHKAEPKIVEAWKWGPAFEMNGLLFGTWAFKKHVSFVFYRGAEMSDKYKLFNYGFDNAHNRMIKFTSIKELDEKKLIAYVKEAVKIDGEGKMSIRKSIAKAEKKIPLPTELSKWFVKNKKAKDFFGKLPFTTRKEMIQLLTNAKQEETRKRRFIKITKALLEGRKTLN